MKRILLLIILLGATLSVGAQSDRIIISIGVEEFWIDEYQSYFGEFEEQHPTIDIVLKPIPGSYYSLEIPADVEDVPEFMQTLSEYVQIADVLPALPITRELVQTGTILDITPLLNADPQANLDDFYPPLLQSVQVDGRTWALPISGSFRVITYDSILFEEQTLPVPDGTWTAQDYITIAQQLTQYDSNNNPEIPGFATYDLDMLFASLLPPEAYDPYADIPVLDYSHPAVLELVQTWAPYWNEISPDLRFTSSPGSGLPLALWRTYDLVDQRGDRLAAAPLPGGIYGVEAISYMISAGTQHRQEAYTVLQHLTRNRSFIDFLLVDTTGRASMLTDAQFAGDDSLPENLRAILLDAQQNALPQVNTYDIQRLIDASQRVANGEDTIIVLNEISEQAQNVLVAIETTAQTLTLEVEQPRIIPDLAPGEIALRFGIDTITLSNRNLWNEAVDTFIESDPQVRFIELDADVRTTHSERTGDYDCYYMTRNIVPFVDMDTLYAVDPLLRSDPDIDMTTFIGDTLQQVTRDDVIRALPLSMNPLVIQLNPIMLENAGVLPPDENWTVDELEDLLQQLTDISGEPAWQSYSSGNTYLLLLIVAYGGIPIDTGTQSPVFDLTTDTTINAIHQVLDLAKNGYIDYTPLAGFAGISGSSQSVPIIDRYLPAINPASNPDTIYALFPSGSAGTPVSYDLGGGYISSETANPEACYRWLSYISQRPELLSGMPVQDWLITENSPAIYHTVRDQLAQPDTITLPSPRSLLTTNTSKDAVLTLYTTLWLNRAFDRYVLEDANLENELSQTQTFITDFNTCAEDIPEPVIPLDEMGIVGLQTYLLNFRTCASQIDPTILPLLPF